MAIRLIRTGDDPVLRTKAKPVDGVTKVIHKLLDDMAETMYDADGVGLAAPQIGISKRVVVMDVGGGIIELINPVILEKSGKQTGSEGCLSIPGIYGDVTRAMHVKIRAMNRDGETFEMEGSELLARCIQHEIDHLDGILFTDYVKPSDLRRVVEGKTSP